jgi:hypothetical protein
MILALYFNWPDFENLGVSKGENLPFDSSRRAESDYDNQKLRSKINKKVASQLVAEPHFSVTLKQQVFQSYIKKRLAYSYSDR